MAYTLGFFTADGSMTKNKRGAHFIELQITDKDLLYKIRQLLGSNHKITERKRNVRWRNTYRLQIGSKEIFSDLLKIGLTPAKSKTVKLPKIPKKYFNCFVRGYFDGDGSVTVSCYKRKNRNNKKYITILWGFISGSRKFLEELRDKLKKIGGFRGGNFCYYSGGYRLFFSVKDSLILYNFMYGDASNNLFLPRKKKIFEKYFKID